MSKKPNPLRELAKKIPDSSEVNEIIKALGSEPDLAAAITGTAIAEAWLERLIISKMKSSSKDLLNRLFNFSGPLGSFDGKILVAEAFGLITSPLAEEFHSIRAIRNAFAHSKFPLDFEHVAISNVIQSMNASTAIRRHDTHIRSNKDWFLLMVEFLLIMTDELTNQELPADEAIRVALAKPSA